MPTLPNSVYATLDPEVHEQIFRSGGQSDANTPSVKFPRQFGTHLLTLLRGERLSQPCSARGLNLEPVAGKRKALTTQPLGFTLCLNPRVPWNTLKTTALEVYWSDKESVALSLNMT
ncbi:hypothetical protein TNCV_1004111 [Trichonephila clavipes]|nr:hypothetical protein TNCV_1004111 [Trichonephila clavipes]